MFTVNWLKSLGIDRQAVAATTAGVAGFQQVLGDGSALEVGMSYILMDDDGGLAQALTTGAELMSQSSVVIAAAGMCAASQDFGSRLMRLAGDRFGLVLFGPEVDGEAALCSGIVVADRSVYSRARTVQEEFGRGAGLAHIAAAYKQQEAISMAALQEGECFMLGLAEPKQIEMLDELWVKADWQARQVAEL